jgi:hypothetical protein
LPEPVEGDEKLPPELPDPSEWLWPWEEELGFQLEPDELDLNPLLLLLRDEPELDDRPDE